MVRSSSVVLPETWRGNKVQRQDFAAGEPATVPGRERVVLGQDPGLEFDDRGMAMAVRVIMVVRMVVTVQLHVVMGVIVMVVMLMRMLRTMIVPVLMAMNMIMDMAVRMFMIMDMAVAMVVPVVMTMPMHHVIAMRMHVRALIVESGLLTCLQVEESGFGLGAAATGSAHQAASSISISRIFSSSPASRSMARGAAGASLVEGCGLERLAARPAACETGYFLDVEQRAVEQRTLSDDVEAEQDRVGHHSGELPDIERHALDAPSLRRLLDDLHDVACNPEIRASDPVLNRCVEAVHQSAYRRCASRRRQSAW